MVSCCVLNLPPHNCRYIEQKILTYFVLRESIAEGLVVMGGAHVLKVMSLIQSTVYCMDIFSN